jgi:hypothetical protein
MKKKSQSQIKEHTYGCISFVQLASTSPGGANESSPGADRGPRQARFWLAGVGKPWGKLCSIDTSPVGGDTPLDFAGDHCCKFLSKRIPRAGWRRRSPPTDKRHPACCTALPPQRLLYLCQVVPAMPQRVVFNHELRCNRRSKAQ